MDCLASFLVLRPIVEIIVKVAKRRNDCHFLSVTPLPTTKESDKEKISEEVSRLSAGDRVNFFQKALEACRVECGAINWIACDFADRATVSPYVTRKMGYGNHASCENHNLSLEGQFIVKSNVELNGICEKLTTLAPQLGTHAK